MMALSATALPATKIDPTADSSLPSKARPTRPETTTTAGQGRREPGLLRQNREQGLSQGPAYELDLVQRHRYGDSSAFEEVYEDYAEMVFGLALGLSADRDRAADLTQGAFLRLYRHLGKFRGGSSLKTWVYRVALNHCRSRLKRRRPDALPLNDDLDGPGAYLPAAGRSPEQQAVARSEARRLRRALAELPARFRDAVVLRDLQELSYDEIAEVLGVRIGTVRSRIARGRTRLRSVLVAMELENAATGQRTETGEQAS